MTRNELAQQVVAKGIKTEKSPFFMSAAQLTELLAATTTKANRGEKRTKIIELIKAGKTRKEILSELSSNNIITTVGYLNNVAIALNLKIVSSKK